MQTNIIYNEDCLVTMAKIPDNSIDLIVTSPPYNKNAHATASGTDKSWSALRGRQIPYDVYSDDMPQADYELWQKKVIEECIRILKPHGSLFYNHKDIIVDGVIIPPKWVYDFNVHQQLIWNRGSSLANDIHYFQPITEYIYWIVKEPKNVFFDKSKSVFRQSIWRINTDKNPHPAPFPLLLVANIIQCASQENSIIYDPFMGSGTTAIATIDIGGGREYIGSEISSKYVEMANKRIENKLDNPKLF